MKLARIALQIVRISVLHVKLLYSYMITNADPAQQDTTDQVPLVSNAMICVALA